MRLIFIRHPQTMANAGKLIYGRTESEYSKEGAASVPWVVEQLKHIHIDEMYVSPLKRTKYLAQQIAEDHGFADMVLEDRIIEMNFGIFENMTNQAAKEAYPEEYRQLLEHYSSFHIPKGESFQMVQQRVIQFLSELEQRENIEIQAQKEAGKGGDCVYEKTIVIVAHSMVIRSALSYLLNISLDDIWHIKLNPAAIADVDYRYGYAMLQQLNCPELA